MDHNKIIATAAKKALGPLGLRREGKSRVWYDDHGWWAIIVEFQPSGWDRGSYLNVAVSWLLYERSHWSFDVGGREEAFRSAAHLEQFEAAIEKVAAQASRSVTQFRERFSSLEQMYSHYRSIKVRAGWPDYYAGVLAGLMGDRLAAERHFSAVIATPCSTTWQHGLRMRSQDLLRLLPEPQFFRDSVLGIVLRSRSAHGLEEMPVAEIGLP